MMLDQRVDDLSRIFEVFTLIYTSLDSPLADI